MSEVALWEQRLEEARVDLEPEVTPERCADRYDVDDRDAIERLTNDALSHAFDAGYGTVALDDLDAAAEQLGVVA